MTASSTTVATMARHSSPSEATARACSALLSLKGSFPSDPVVLTDDEEEPSTPGSTTKEAQPCTQLSDGFLVLNCTHCQSPLLWDICMECDHTCHTGNHDCPPCQLDLLHHQSSYQNNDEVEHGKVLEESASVLWNRARRQSTDSLPEDPLSHKASRPKRYLSADSST